MTKKQYETVKQRPNQFHSHKKDYNRQQEKSVNYDEYQENPKMSIKTFEEYQIDHNQLFEARAAFEAAVEMCIAHYEGSLEEEVVAVGEVVEEAQIEDVALSEDIATEEPSEEE